MSDDLVVGASWCSWTKQQLEVIRENGNHNLQVCFVDAHTKDIPKCSDDVTKMVQTYPSFVEKTGGVSPGFKDAQQLTQYLSRTKT